MDESPAMPRKDKIRYLVWRPGAAGALRRYYWQPSAALAGQGYEQKRIPDDWDDFDDQAALYEAAAAAALTLNGALDRARLALPPSAEAAAKADAVVRRTIANLIAAYKLSDAYTTLGGKTQSDYGRCLDRISNFAIDADGRAGGAPIRAMDAPYVKKFRATMAHTPAMANACIRVLRLLLNWGMDKNNKHPNGGPWCRENPAADPSLEAAAVSGRIWPRQAVALFVAKADALGLVGIGTAVTLDEWLGQREADILRMTRTVLNTGSSGGRRLIFRQAKGTNAARGKTGAGVVLPVEDVPELIARIDLQLAWNDAFYRRKDEAEAPAPPARAPRQWTVSRRAQRTWVQPAPPPPSATVTPLQIILSDEGKPYKADHFRHQFADVRAALEADMLTAAGWVAAEGTRTDKAGNTVPALIWRNQAVENRLGNLPAKEKAAELEIARRRAASFEIDYLLPGRDPVADPDAFRVYVGELQFMHLRHTAITRLGEIEGMTVELIGSVSGHSFKTITTILERYLIRTAAMARTAFAMRLKKEAQGGN